jgi:hypothetical protein
VILTCLLAVGGLFVVVGALWLAIVSWAALGDVGRFALLGILTGGIAVAGRSLGERGYARSGFALLVIASQLIWANGAYLIFLLKLEEKPGAWCLLAALVAALTFGFALSRSSTVLATLATIDTIFASLFLGAALSTGAATGAAIWCLVTSALLAGVAFVAHRRGGIRLGLPPALGAFAFTLGSWVAGLALAAGSDTQLFACVWPYGVLALTVVASVGLSRAGERAYAIVALVALWILATLTPTVEALSHWDEVGFEYGATIAGGLLIVAAFHWPPLRDREGPQLLAVFAGLVSVTVPPAFTALGRLANLDGDRLLGELLELDFAARVNHPLFCLPYLVGTSGALVALGVLFSRDAERTLPYRALELAGLGAFFLTLTVLSLFRYSEFLYPAVIFGGGLAALGAGVWRRHVILVVVPALFLVLNVWIQYFAKLTEPVPLALLLMGFGIGVLVSGVLFEKKVKPFLPELKTWA